MDVLGDILGNDYLVLNAGVSSMTMMKRGICNDLGKLLILKSSHPHYSVLTQADGFRAVLLLGYTSLE